MNNREIYRPNASLVFAGIGVLLCALFVWSSFYEGGARSEVTSALVALFVITFIYIFLVRPKILFADEGIVIINPIEEFTIGWADVIAMDTRWALSIETKEFTVSAWAGTASGRPRRSIHHTEIKGLDIELGGSMRVGDSPHSDSGAAAYRARTRLKRFNEVGGIPSLVTGRKRQLEPLLLALVLLVAAIAINFAGH
jgi:hypothetical protein